MRVRKRIWIFTLIVLSISVILFYFKPVPAIKELVEDFEINFLQTEPSSP